MHVHTNTSSVKADTATTTTPAVVMSWTEWEAWSQCRQEGVHLIRNRVRRLCDVNGSGCTDALMENATCTIGTLCERIAT